MGRFWHHAQAVRRLLLLQQKHKRDLKGVTAAVLTKKVNKLQLPIDQKFRGTYVLTY